MRSHSNTSSFKKDLKKVTNRGKDLSKLLHVMDLLIEGQTLPQKLKDHSLGGQFRGCRDCHLEPDWLLIYEITENGSHVSFLRTGTHSDIFE